MGVVPYDVLFVVNGAADLCLQTVCWFCSIISSDKVVIHMSEDPFQLHDDQTCAHVALASLCPVQTVSCGCD